MSVKAILTEQQKSYTKAEEDALLAQKQDTITVLPVVNGGTGNSSVDTTPTINSSKMVTSGGVYDNIRTRVPVYGLGENLLRNWYFIGGGTEREVFPVNSRAGSNYTGGSSGTITIDNWAVREVNNTIQLQSDGILVSKGSSASQCDFYQRLPIGLLNALQGKVVTASALCEHGLLTGTFTWSSSYNTVASNSYVTLFSGGSSTDYRNFCIRVTNSEKIYAAKLELGSEQTLAYQESNTWVLNEIPNYEEELIKCLTNTATSTDTFSDKTIAVEQQIAHTQFTTTADHTYKVGEHFCYSGNLYRVTTPVLAGTLLEANTNCRQTTVGEGLVSTRTVTQTTSAAGRINTALQTSNSIVLSAIANGYFCSVYVNNDVQGVEIRDITSGNPVASKSVTVTLVVLYII